jgi:hypothetical protein
MTSISPSQPGQVLPSSPRLKQLNVICWTLLLVGFVLPFSIIVIGSHRPPDGDFAGFYSLGRIANTHPMKDLYNYELQQQVCNQVHPRQGMYGLLPYPPFVGLFFQPFALLPYSVAYGLWLLISLTLYAAGLKLLIDRFLPLEPVHRSLLFCFAFAYRPFLVDTASSGQLTAVGFFALSAALCLDDAGHHFRSGLVLALCLYKPTLLLLLLPMLLVTRRFRSLLGFTAGAVALASLPTAIAGFAIWPVFFRTILTFGKIAGGTHAATILFLVKYVDFSSFSALVHGGRSGPGLAILCASAGAAALSLIWFWWKAPRYGKPFHALLWATTITWTLLLNVYVPIYDSTLVVLSLIVTAGVLKRIPQGPIHRAFTLLWILILTGSWFTVILAGLTGVQLLTLLFAALGVLQFLAFSRIARPQPCSAQSVP